MPRQTLEPAVDFVRRLDAAGREADADLLTRFVRDGDETAFAMLLKRYGPMVLGVCRRVLRDRHEAEDAFQSTFLILVRKAPTLQQPGLLGNWLYGVAYRTALKARTTAARHPTPLLCADPTAPEGDEVLWRDLRPVLDDAINRLPDRYRVPFVLCCLRGLTNAQAAQLLGRPEGTIATQLSRARQRLRARLAGHGLTAALGGASPKLWALATAPTPPALLVVSTLRIATAFRLGASGAAPVAVATLTEGVCTTMLLEKLRPVLVAACLTVALLCSTAAWSFATIHSGSTVAQPAEPQPAAIPQPAKRPLVHEEKEATKASVRTDNFVVHAPNRRIAQLVGESAERSRKAEALRWLGKELPVWTEPCSVVVTIREREDTHHATYHLESGKVKSRSMTLDGSLDQLLSNALPHEITHLVLADVLRRPIPRWADEGAALLAEDSEEQERHQRLMRDLVRSNRLLPLSTLLPLTSYPRDVAAFYAEAYSLTRFLVAREDRKTFLAFVLQGVSTEKWDKAVQEHYYFADVTALEKAWLDFVRKEARLDTPAVGAKQERKLKATTPAIGRGSVDEKGRVLLLQKVHCYEPRARATDWLGGATDAGSIVYELVVREHATRCNPEEITATELDGTPINSKALSKRLQTPTTVLIGTPGLSVDPDFLSIVKEGTIILTPKKVADPAALALPTIPSAPALAPVPPTPPVFSVPSAPSLLPSRPARP